MLAVLVLGACSPPAAPVPAATSAAPSSSPPTASAAAPSPGRSATPSGPCLDVGDLADLGEPVGMAMQLIKPALAAQKVDDARSAAQTAIKGLATIGDLVGPASPRAKELFLAAATELTQAASQFPNGGSLVDQSKHDLDEAFVVAEAARCAA